MCFATPNVFCDSKCVLRLLNVFCDFKCVLRFQMCFATSNVFCDSKCVLRLLNVSCDFKCVLRFQMCFATSNAFCDSKCVLRLQNVFLQQQMCYIKDKRQMCIKTYQMSSQLQKSYKRTNCAKQTLSYKGINIWNKLDCNYKNIMYYTTF